MNFHQDQPPITSGRKEVALIEYRAKEQTLEQRVIDLEDYIFCLKSEIRALWEQKANIEHKAGPVPPRPQSHAIGLHN